jgi:hypothetical protein
VDAILARIAAEPENVEAIKTETQAQRDWLGANWPDLAANVNAALEAAQQKEAA